MKLLIIIVFLLSTFSNAREVGQTEITTEEGIEVYQKDKFYLLKKNVEILSDSFNLNAENVKAYFEKDLYDITEIYSTGNVKLVSSQGLEAKGEIINFNVKNENIYIEGLNSYLNTNSFIMNSNKLIEVNNANGVFKLVGSTSSIKSETTVISGSNIDGSFTNIEGKNIIEKIHATDEEEVNIKTEKLDMFALTADFDKENNLIELFENVRIFKGDEQITGDYAKINTLDESYKITSKDSKKVKVILKNVNE